MKVEFIPSRKDYELFLELFPPQLSNKFLPEWYKKGTKLKGSERHGNFKHQINPVANPPITIKSCPAIVDAVTEGIIIPLWGSLDFATEKHPDDVVTNHWDFTGRHINQSDISEHIQYHKKNQLEGMPVNTLADESILKLTMPYKVIVPEGYNIYYTDPFYHFRKSIRLLSGVVEADKWGYVTFVFEVLEENFRIEAGEPLVQLFIYKREEEKINLTCRNGTLDEYDQVVKEHRELFVTEKNYKTKDK
tara:strand:+ start:1409 stop:2152 length:744 start_codon:yes stop_codon:yes gene_type:complete